METQHDQYPELATIRRQIGHDDATSDDIAIRLIEQARERHRAEQSKYRALYDPIINRDDPSLHSRTPRLPRVLWRALGLLAVMAAIYALIVASGLAHGLELPSVLQWIRGR